VDLALANRGQTTGLGETVGGYISVWSGKKGPFERLVAKEKGAALSALWRQDIRETSSAAGRENGAIIPIDFILTEALIISQ